MSFENWTIEDLFTRCMDCDDMTLEMDKEEFAALRRKISELRQAGNSPVIPGAEQRIADAVELLKQAAPAMLTDNSGPDGPLVGRLKSPAIGIDIASGPDRTVEVRYGAPPGYVMVPKEPTKEMIDAGWLHFMGSKNPSSKGTYEAMLAAAPAGIPMNSDGWIPVSERIPETNKFVLVSNGVWVGQGLYDDSEHLESDERWQDEHREFINVLHHPVTHWMPLPAAPKQEII